MSDYNDLDDALVLGDLSHALSRGLLHAMSNVGGDLQELKNAMKDKKTFRALLEGLAKKIIDAPLWLKVGRAFSLAVDHETTDEAFLLNTKPTEFTKFIHYIDERIMLWESRPPKKRCQYRLRHVDRPLSLPDLLRLPLPEGMEHATWRELFVAACMMDDIDPKGYSILALGSVFSDAEGLHVPHLVGDRRKHRENQTLFYWHPKQCVYRKTTRRFYLVRDYSSSST